MTWIADQDDAVIYELPVRGTSRSRDYLLLVVNIWLLLLDNQ
jgi:hypothetical protein